MRKTFVATLLLLIVSPAAYAATPAPAGTLSAAEQTAVFKRAGFKERSGKWVRCEEETASAMPGWIEVVDLNGDGGSEVWVKESNMGCYGDTEWFALLTKDANGSWRVLLEGAGIAMAKDAKHNGWPDIEVGGPGSGPFPTYRWDGKTYGKAR